MLLSNLMFIEGRQIKNQIKASTFIPNYLGEEKVQVEKTLEQQQREFAAFHAKIKSMSK